MELEVGRSYLVRRKEHNFGGTIEECTLIKESSSCYKFEYSDYGNTTVKWIPKLDFEEDYKIIEIL